MEKEKKQITVADIWAQRFWIGCGLVTVACLVAFILSSMSLSTIRGQRAKALDSKKAEIETVLKAKADVSEEYGKITVHPNATTEVGMKTKISSASDVAIKAWEMQYASQQEYLKWPEVVPANIRNELDKIKQPEVSNFKMQEVTLETYAEVIPKVMPQLAAKIGAQWDHEDKKDTSKINQKDDGGSASIDDTEAEEEKNDVVLWNKENQAIWNDKLTKFIGRNGNTQSSPTISQVFALQQDLWLLGGVFDVIKVVNGDINANDLAYVKSIDHILIGREVGDIQKIGQVTAAEEAIKTGGQTRRNTAKKPPAQQQPAKKDNSMSGPQRQSMGTYSAPTKVNERVKRKRDAEKAKKRTPPVNNFVPSESESPFHGRYVDWDFIPVSEKELSEALAPKELVKKSYLHVARRIPVRIAVTMDERKIPEFLAACVNSPFVIEVDRFRVNGHVPNEGYLSPDKSQANRDDGKKKREIQGGGSGTDGGAANIDDTGGASSADGPMTGLSYSSIEQRTSFDVNVEFYGVVKLYNPVEKEKALPILNGKSTKPKEESKGKSTAGGSNGNTSG